jgi:hypothetical protein
MIDIQGFVPSVIEYTGRHDSEAKETHEKSTLKEYTLHGGDMPHEKYLPKTVLENCHAAGTLWNRYTIIGDKK